MGRLLHNKWSMGRNVHLKRRCPMKAAFTLIPSESRRLIAKAVIQMKEVKIAKKKAYIILGGGTTNGYVAQELLGRRDIEPVFTAGTSITGFFV
jgi:hypothetical protein